MRVYGDPNAPLCRAHPTKVREKGIFKFGDSTEKFIVGTGEGNQTPANKQRIKLSGNFKGFHSERGRMRFNERKICARLALGKICAVI